MAITVNWSGKSGLSYDFEVHPIGSVEYLPVSGVYVLCRAVPFGLMAGYEALYVGESNSLHDRLNTGLRAHDGFKRAAGYGVTHIGTRRAGDLADRLRVETDLRHGLNPVCNAQPVPGINGIMAGLLRN